MLTFVLCVVVLIPFVVVWAVCAAVGMLVFRTIKFSQYVGSAQYHEDVRSRAHADIVPPWEEDE